MLDLVRGVLAGPLGEAGPATGLRHAVLLDTSPNCLWRRGKAQGGKGGLRVRVA